MAVQYMAHNKTIGRHIHAESVAIGATSEPLILPSVYARSRADDRVSVVCIPTAGATGIIEYCIETAEDVIAGSAVWIEWPVGAVTAAAGYAINGGVTALRCKNTAGAEVVNWRVMK